MSEATVSKSAFVPFQGNFSKRFFALAGVQIATDMVGMYATVLVSNIPGGPGIAAKVSEVFHTLERKDSESEVFTLFMSGGKIVVAFYPDKACMLCWEGVGSGKITSFILGKENRVLCNKDGFLK